MFNKSFTTNLLSLLCVLTGMALSQPLVLSVGLFALSGAVTNWLAIHMLFEKVPGLYGSGIIPARFEEFKNGIQHLIMDEFFTKDNIDRFFNTEKQPQIVFAPIIANIDLAPSFDNLLGFVEKSSFGGFLGMLGGTKALSPMKDPFIDTMRKSIMEIVQSENFQTEIQDVLGTFAGKDEILERVNTIVQQRLEELTPESVKEIIQKMIRKHLGWLVVWGGVFGGLIGLITYFIR
jgi:uncharacterized membrane protein YheB (UPF0754 family)